MRVRKIIEDLLEHLQRDQEGVQRIFGQRVGAREDLVEQDALAFEIPFGQCMGEFTLVCEVAEEPTLRDADSCDDLFDRRRGKTSGEDGCLCGVEDALAPVAGDRGWERRTAQGLS